MNIQVEITSIIQAFGLLGNLFIFIHKEYINIQVGITSICIIYAKHFEYNKWKFSRTNMNSIFVYKEKGQIMEVEDFIFHNKVLQEKILGFIEDKGEDDLKSITNTILDHNISKNSQKLFEIIHLVLKIMKNHQRSNNFFSKFERIFFEIKDGIKRNFSNTEIFIIFQNNKRILLFLFQNQVISVDKSICSLMKNSKFSKTMMYYYYFFPEIKSFLCKTEKNKIEKELFDLDQNIFQNFEEKRQLGENESYICTLIRNDSVEEFISVVIYLPRFLHFVQKPRQIYPIRDPSPALSGMIPHSH